MVQNRASTFLKALVEENLINLIPWASRENLDITLIIIGHLLEIQKMVMAKSGPAILVQIVAVPNLPMISMTTIIFPCITMKYLQNTGERTLYIKINTMVIIRPMLLQSRMTGRLISTGPICCLTDPVKLRPIISRIMRTVSQNTVFPVICPMIS